MVGRLIVGQPIGPGSLPFDWFKGRPEARDWLPVPATARATFPSMDDIMRRGTVPDKLLGMAHSETGADRNTERCRRPVTQLTPVKAQPARSCLLEQNEALWSRRQRLRDYPSKPCRTAHPRTRGPCTRHPAASNQASEMRT